jgi:HK97 family phage major capsid protein
VGNFDRYAIVRRSGMRIEVVPHLLGTATNLPSGQRGFYAWSRVGAGPTGLNGFRLLQNQ